MRPAEPPGLQDDGRIKECKRCKRCKPFTVEYYSLKHYIYCRDCWRALQIALSDSRKQLNCQSDPIRTGEKICSKCHLPKPRTDFAIARRQPGGLHQYCRSCNSLHVATYYWKQFFLKIDPAMVQGRVARKIVSAVNRLGADSVGELVSHSPYAYLCLPLFEEILSVINQSYSQDRARSSGGLE